MIKKCNGGNLHLIGIPKQWERAVARETTKALTEAGKLFGYQKSVNITVVSASSESIIPELGIGGTLYYNGVMSIDLDFSRKDI